MWKDEDANGLSLSASKMVEESLMGIHPSINRAVRKKVVHEQSSSCKASVIQRGLRKQI